MGEVGIGRTLARGEPVAGGRVDASRGAIPATSLAGKVPIDADITIRTMRGGARDLDGVKDPGKCNPTQGFLAIETARLTDIPNQVCQCRHEQGREYRIPDGHVLLSGFVETHCE